MKTWEMAGQRRTKAQQARDAQQAASLYLQGYTQIEIAARLGRSVATVYRDLLPYIAQWREQASTDIAEIKAQELAATYQLQREYWEAWERSKTPRKTSTVRRAADGSGSGAEAIVRSEERIGDSRFLQGILACMERRARLLGLDAAVKADLTSGGEPLALRIEVVYRDHDDSDINPAP